MATAAALRNPDSRRLLRFSLASRFIYSCCRGAIVGPEPQSLPGPILGGESAAAQWLRRSMATFTRT
ncbi:hypothetical protein GW17_00021295 [Ensete ventricosum]|nr:hypothetical protein GW17_00021295 [Ensete ventricosum]